MLTLGLAASGQCTAAASTAAAAQIPALRALLQSRQSASSMQKHYYSWRKFRAWCINLDLKFMPAAPLTVALYLTSLVPDANTNSVLLNARNAIAAFHTSAGVESPTLDQLVVSMLQGGKRLLAKPVDKKEPLTLANVAALTARFTAPGASPTDHYVVTAVAVAFFGFFRFSDLAAITFDQLRFSASHVSVTLPQRKTDQWREGSTVLIARVPGETWCPVTLLRRHVERFKISGTAPVFMDLKKSTAAASPANYQRFRHLLLERLSAIGLDASHFGTHSMRAGGATLAANAGVPEPLLMEHGGWHSQTAARGYVKTSVPAQLSVTLTMVAAAEPALPQPPPPPPPRLSYAAVVQRSPPAPTLPARAKRAAVASPATSPQPIARLTASGRHSQAKKRMDL